MIKLCGIVAVVGYGIGAAIDWEYYGVTARGMSIVLAWVAGVSLSIGTIWRLWLGKVLKRIWERTALAMINAIATDRALLRKLVSRAEQHAIDIKSNGDKLDQAIDQIDFVTVRQSLILKSFEQIVCVTDPVGNITVVSEGFTELTGLDTHAVQDNGWYQVIHRDDLQNVINRRQSCLVPPGHGDTIDFRFIVQGRKNCQRVTSHIQTFRGKPAANGERKLLGFFIYTEKKGDPQPYSDCT